MAHGLEMAQVEARIEAWKFFTFVLDTGVVNPGQPLYATSMWSSKLSRAPVYRNQLRELTAAHAYVTECKVAQREQSLQMLYGVFQN